MSEAYKLFRCFVCGFEYDEAKGWPDDGIEPGTRWDDIPDDWSCPDRGAAKGRFRDDRSCPAITGLSC